MRGLRQERITSKVQTIVIVLSLFICTIIIFKQQTGVTTNLSVDKLSEKKGPVNQYNHATNNISTTITRRMNVNKTPGDNNDNPFSVKSEHAFGFIASTMSSDQENFDGFLYNVDPDLLRDALFHKHKYVFTINSEETCNKKYILLVTVTHSSPDNRNNRNRIRRTWGSVKHVHPSVLVVGPVFLLGQIGEYSNTTQTELEKEANVYKDMVQGNFVDSYKNLTYKNIMGLHWLQRYCKYAVFALKTDDDVLVNVPDLVEYLIELTIDNRFTDFLYCTPILGTAPMRNKSKKWYVSEKDYPFEIFPPYCQGFAYVMSNDVIKKLYDASCDVRYFWIDDMLVTGFLARKAGISRTNVHRKHNFVHLSYKDTKDNTFFSIQNKTFLEYWNPKWEEIRVQLIKYRLKELLVYLLNKV